MRLRESVVIGFMNLVQGRGRRSVMAQRMGRMSGFQWIRRGNRLCRVRYFSTAFHSNMGDTDSSTHFQSLSRFLEFGSQALGKPYGVLNYCSN